MDSALLDQSPGKGHALRRVVVAADDKNLHPTFHQPDQKIVQQSDRLRGGHRLVIEIPGQNHCIRAFLIDNIDDFCQDIGLILQHAELIDSLSQMQI